MLYKFAELKKNITSCNAVVNFIEEYNANKIYSIIEYNDDNSIYRIYLFAKDSSKCTNDYEYYTVGCINAVNFNLVLNYITSNAKDAFKSIAKKFNKPEEYIAYFFYKFGKTSSHVREYTLDSKMIIPCYDEYLKYKQECKQKELEAKEIASLNDLCASINSTWDSFYAYSSSTPMYRKNHKVFDFYHVELMVGKDLSDKERMDFIINNKKKIYNYIIRRLAISPSFKEFNIPVGCLAIYGTHIKGHILKIDLCFKTELIKLHQKLN